MALNLEALKKKLEQLNGTSKGSGRNEKLWKAPPGDYVIRIVPFQDNDGQPFKERWFYYNIGNQSLLSPNQFGQKDPIQELINKLRASGDPKDKEFCKRLYPKMRAYIPIIVRGEEDKGVRFWSIGKMIYQDLIGKFLDEEYGDISDVTDGFDIKVKITQIQGKDFADTKVDVARKPSKLSSDPEQIQKWIDAIPNLDEMYSVKSYDEIKTIVDAWLTSSTETSAPAEHMPQTVGESPVPETAQKSGGKNKKKDLDAAFAELTSDD